MKIVCDRAIADALGISVEKMNDIKREMIKNSHMKHKIKFLEDENKKLKEKLEKHEPKAKKYRKKPLVIEAVIYESIDQIKRYFPNIEVRDDNRASKAISLKTLEDWVELQVGDYVIKPCKPDIFVETYERI